MELYERCPYCGYRTQGLTKEELPTEVEETEEGAEKTSPIIQTNTIKSSSFTSSIKMEDIANSNFKGNSGATKKKKKKEKPKEEDLFFKCSSCGETWQRRVRNGKIVITDDLVEKSRKKALEDIKENASKTEAYITLAIGVVFGFLTYLCISYCINNDSSYTEHIDKFFLIEAYDEKFISYSWYFSLLGAIVLFLVTLILLFGSYLSYKEPGDYSKVRDMSVADYKKSEYMELYPYDS